MNIRTDRLLYDHLLGPIQLEWLGRERQARPVPDGNDDQLQSSSREQLAEQVSS